MLDFVLSFSVNETNNYVLMENVVKEHGFSTPDNYNLIRCAKVNNFCFILFLTKKSRSLNGFFLTLGWFSLVTLRLNGF